MRLQVDFYKTTGKWYSGIEVDIPEFESIMYKLTNLEIRLLIYEKQQAVRDPGVFHMVAKNTNPDGEFFARLFPANET